MNFNENEQQKNDCSEVNRNGIGFNNFQHVSSLEL